METLKLMIRVMILVAIGVVSFLHLVHSVSVPGTIAMYASYDIVVDVPNTFHFVFWWWGSMAALILGSILITGQEEYFHNMPRSYRIFFKVVFWTNLVAFAVNTGQFVIAAEQWIPYPLSSFATRMNIFRQLFMGWASLILGFAALLATIKPRISLAEPCAVVLDLFECLEE